MVAQIILARLQDMALKLIHPLETFRPERSFD